MSLSSRYDESLEKLNESLKKAGKKPVIIRAADEDFEDERRATHTYSALS